MKKLLFLLCFLPFCLSAQTPEPTKSDTLSQRTSYQSFFGKKKTDYCICILEKVASFTSKGKSLNTFGYPCTSVKCCFNEKEQIFNGKSYKYEISIHQDSMFKFERDILLREDTTLGRLYRYYPELDTEVVLCDMSLQQGDTFRIPWMHIPAYFPNYSYYEADLPIIVDTIIYVKGMKHILFKYISRKDPWSSTMSNFYDDRDGICKKNDIILSFIEGIGPSYGLGYILFLKITDRCLPLMLCLHKDDSLAFMLHEPTGCALYVYPKPQIKEAKRTTLALQPNPAQDYILLRNEDASDLGGEIIITDAVGRVLRHCTMENAEMRINTGGYSSGTYFVRYRSKNGVQTLKFVKVE